MDIWLVWVAVALNLEDEYHDQLRLPKSSGSGPVTAVALRLALTTLSTPRNPIQVATFINHGNFYVIIVELWRIIVFHFRWRYKKNRQSFKWWRKSKYLQTLILWDMVDYNKRMQMERRARIGCPPFQLVPAYCSLLRTTKA